MSRHKLVKKFADYDDDYGDYDDYDDDYDDAPRPQMNKMSVQDFMPQVKPKKKSKKELEFLKNAKEILTSSHYDRIGEDVMLDTFKSCNSDKDRAIETLLTNYPAEAPRPSMNSIFHQDAITSPSKMTIPRPKNSPATSTRKSDDAPRTMTISRKEFNEISKLAQSPQKDDASGTASNSAPSPKRTQSNPDLAYKPPSRAPTPQSLSRANSSGQLNRMAALSDDDVDETPPTGKSKLTLVVAGHVDAGKSTLIGHLLYKQGLVTSHTLQKYEKESQVTGKGSFSFAWVTDTSEAERARGATIHITKRRFETENRIFTLIDAPGHRDFIPNMISGSNQADVAMLVVPASTGEYESSMGDNAQTREHAVLLKAMGVNQILVVVNKMDMTTPVLWSKERYDLIRSEITQLLTELQFKSIQFVPISGLEGVNIVDREPNNAYYGWYDGPTLVQQLEALKEPVRHSNRILRGVITAVVSETPRGYELSVRVLQGRLRRNRGIGIAQIQGVFDVKKITRDDGVEIDTLWSGEEAVVLLTDRANRSHEEVKLSEGLVLYKGNPVPPTCRLFKATILTMAGLMPPIIPGSSYELYLHGEEVQCYVRKLYSVSQPQGIIKHPKCIGGAKTAVVKIESFLVSRF